MDQVSVYNAALSAIGSKFKFATVNDAGVEMETCNLWYTTVRDQVLRAANWAAAAYYAKLVLHKERDTAADWVVTDPPPGYLFAYLPPAAMLRPRYLTDYSQFELSQASDGTNVINTNSEIPILSYTGAQNDTTSWDADLTMCMIYALAAHIAPKLTGKMDRARTMQELANNIILNARTTEVNQQENRLPDWVAPWHAARGFATGSETRFIYPYGPLINAAFF